MSVFSISIALIHILSLISVEAHDRGRNSNDSSSSGDAGDNSASAAVAADYARLESMFNQPIMNLIPISLDQHTSKTTAASTVPTTHASTGGPGEHSSTGQLARTTGSTSASIATTTNPLDMPIGTGVGGSSGFLRYPTAGGMYHNTSPSGSAPSSGSKGGLPYQTQGAPYLNSSLPWNGGSGGSLGVGRASATKPSMQPSRGSRPNSTGNACPPVQTVTLPASTVTLPASTITVTAQAQMPTTPQTVTRTVTTTITITKDSGCHCSIPNGNPLPNPASGPLHPISSGLNIPNSAGSGGPPIPAGSHPAKTQASQNGTTSVPKNPLPETGGSGRPQPSPGGPGAVVPGGRLPTETSQSNQGGLNPSSPRVAQPVPQTLGTQPSHGGATNMPHVPASQPPLSAPYRNATGSHAVMPTGSGSSGTGCPTAGSKGSGRLPFPNTLPAPGNGTKGIVSPTGTGIPMKPGASASFPVPGGPSLPGFPTGSQSSMGFATASNGIVPSLATGVQQTSSPSYAPPSNTSSALNDTGSSSMPSPCPEKSSSSPTSTQQSASPPPPDSSTSMPPSTTASRPASSTSAAPPGSSSTCFSNHTSLQRATATVRHGPLYPFSGMIWTNTSTVRRPRDPAADRPRCRCSQPTRRGLQRRIGLPGPELHLLQIGQQQRCRIRTQHAPGAGVERPEDDHAYCWRGGDELEHLRAVAGVRESRSAGFNDEEEKIEVLEMGVGATGDAGQGGWGCGGRPGLQRADHEHAGAFGFSKGAE